MRRRNLFPSFIAIFITSIMLITGCGEVTNKLPVQHRKLTNIIPFMNELNWDKSPINPYYNPSVASSSLYRRVSVVNESGQKVVLNAMSHPILFEAYWCPHCQRTLVMLNKNRNNFKKFPIIVSVGFFKGTTLKLATQITHQELNTFKIQHVNVYYMLNPNAGVQYASHGYPTLVFSRQHQLLSLSGEHTLSVWTKALN